MLGLARRGSLRSPRVTLRVTNVPPRRGDSWLNRMPLLGVEAVRVAVLDGHPVGEDLRDRVRDCAGWNGVVSLCGVSTTWPYISEEPAW